MKETWEWPQVDLIPRWSRPFSSPCLTGRDRIICANPTLMANAFEAYREHHSLPHKGRSIASIGFKHFYGISLLVIDKCIFQDEVLHKTNQVNSVCIAQENTHLLCWCNSFLYIVISFIITLGLCFSGRLLYCVVMLWNILTPASKHALHYIRAHIFYLIKTNWISCIIPICFTCMV